MTTVIGALRAVQQNPVPDSLVPRVQRAVHQTVSAATGGGHFWARVTVPVAVATGLAALAFALRAPAPHALKQARAPVVAQAPAAEQPPAGAAGAAIPGRGGMRGGRPGGAPRRATPQATPFALPLSPGGGGILGSPTLGASPDAHKQAAPAQQPKREAPPTYPVFAPPGPAALRAAPQEETAPPRELRDVAEQPRSTESAAQPEREPAPSAPQPAKSAGAGAAASIPPTVSHAKSVRTAAAAPRVAARVGLLSKGGRVLIAVHFTPEKSNNVFKVSIGAGPDRRTVRRGPKNVFPVTITPADVGDGPAAIPITVKTERGERDYVLFAPTMVRLGEAAPESPHARYDGAPLEDVLLDFAALTGIVILAEEPLDRQFIGDLPSGTPEATLEQLAAGLNLGLKRQGRVAYLLSQR